MTGFQKAQEAAQVQAAEVTEDGLWEALGAKKHLKGSQKQLTRVATRAG